MVFPESQFKLTKLNNSLSQLRGEWSLEQYCPVVIAVRSEPVSICSLIDFYKRLTKTPVNNSVHKRTAN